MEEVIAERDAFMQEHAQYGEAINQATAHRLKLEGIIAYLNKKIQDNEESNNGDTDVPKRSD